MDCVKCSSADFFCHFGEKKKGKNNANRVEMEAFINGK